MNKLVIIGASGHGKVVCDIAVKLQKYEEIIFLDDDDTIKCCMGFPVVGTCQDMEKYINEAEYIVAIGDNHARKILIEQLSELGAHIAILIHPNASIASGVLIEKGTVVMAGTAINPDSRIGLACIVNSCASVDHDCEISNYVHVSVGAHVCGNAKIGESTWIGAGATVKNNTSVCDNCIVGVGAAVVNDLEKEGTYVGVPARRIK